MAKNYSSYATMAVPWIVFLVFISSTHPADLPVYVLLVPFFLLGVAIYVTLGSLVSKITRSSSRHQKAVTILMTLFIVVCFGLQSVGQLTFRDLMTVLALTLLSYFYVYRNIIGTKQ
jgi:hypothetical protein